MTIFALPEVIKLAGDFETNARPSERVHFVPGQCGVLVCQLSLFGRPYLSPVWGECAAVVRSQPAKARDVGSVPGSGRSPGGGHDNPLQYSCLENPWTEEPGGLQSVWLQ